MTKCIASTWMVLLLIWGSLPAGEGGDRYEQNWPEWRGPLATGVAPHANPPITWSEDNNIHWKLAMPGSGNSSPIVWDEHVFVTTAVASEEAGAEAPAGERRWRGGVAPTQELQFVIMAVARESGEIEWHKTLRSALPHAGTHVDGSWAAHSPVTDGDHLIVSFGSNGLYGLDMKGDLLWEKDLGDMRTRRSFGEGSSPALYGDKVVVNWDHEGDSFIVALDKQTGEELWRRERDEPTSWSTPVIVEHDGRPQVIVNATNRVRSYDLATGAEIWQSKGMTVNTIPSPVHDDGLVVVMSGFRGNALQTIRLAGAKGDLHDSGNIVWTYKQDTPYVPSPLLYDDLLYFTKHNRAILSCFDIHTGKAHYVRQRLDGIQGVYASPVGAAGHVYLAGRNGVTLVIKNQAEFEVVAQNVLDDGFDASPAVVDQEIYLRGRDFLYAIKEKE